MALPEKSCKRNYYTGLRRGAGGAPCPPGGLRGALGAAVGWGYLLPPQPAGRSSSSQGFSCPSPGLCFSASPGAVGHGAVAPLCWELAAKGGSAFGTPGSRWWGVQLGSVRGDGAVGRVSLCSGCSPVPPAAGLDEGCARPVQPEQGRYHRRSQLPLSPGLAPSSKTSRALLARLILPHPCWLPGPSGPQVLPCESPSVFGSPVAAGFWPRSSVVPSLGVLRQAWHRSGGEMCRW